VSQFENLKAIALKSIHIFPAHFITNEILTAAYLQVKDIDENDTVFLATAMFLNAYLWTGDKKLYDGLNAKKSQRYLIQQI
jgi:predicted nucleic acid-binding protein